MSNRTIPALMAAAAIGAQIDRVKVAVTELKELLHTTAIQCLMHAQQHGDVTLCERLYKAVDGGEDKNAAVRAEGLKLWMTQHAPFTARQGVWRMKKGWKKEEFKIQEALDMPYWLFSREQAPRQVSFDTFLNLIIGLPKRLENAKDEERFVGDALETEHVINEIIDFAKAKAKMLTPEQRGETQKKPRPVPAPKNEGHENAGDTPSAAVA